MEKVKKAIILCGGLATRFLPISKSVPKEMLPLLDKPILQYIVEDLSKAGIEDIMILVGRGKECILNHFDKNVELEQRLSRTGKLDLLEKVKKIDHLANIVYKRQYEPKGTGCGIESAKSFLGDDPFVLMFGDEVTFCDGENVVKQLLDSYSKEKNTVIAVKEVPKEEVYKYGIINPDKKIENGYRVKGIVEKPKVEEAPSNISYIGPAVITKDIFPILEKIVVPEGEEKVVTEAFEELCKKGKLSARIIEGDRHDMGNKFGFVRANIYAALRDKECKEEMIKLILNLAEEIKK